MLETFIKEYSNHYDIKLLEPFELFFRGLQDATIIHYRRGIYRVKKLKELGLVTHVFIASRANFTSRNMDAYIFAWELKEIGIDLITLSSNGRIVPYTSVPCVISQER